MDWKRYSPDGAQLSIDLPGEPMDMGQAFREFLKGSSMYVSYRKQLFTVVSRLELPGQANEALLTAGFTAMLSRISEGAEVKYQIVSRGAVGTIVHGTTTMAGQQVETRALLSSKGASAWMIITLFPRSAASTLGNAADRIINSVKLEPKARSAPGIVTMLQRPLWDVSLELVLAPTRTAS
jgi:hypothetical protein